MISADRLQKTLYVTDAHAYAHFVFAGRALPVGARVRVSGSQMQGDPSTVWATGSDGKVTATGSARAVSVRGELGFIDTERKRFQLGVRGQVAGEVTYPARLEQVLKQESLFPPHRGDLLFRLGIRAGSLSLLALPT